MAVQVNKVYQIIIAITIQVQAVDGVGVQVGSIIGRDKSAPFGRVIPGVAVVEAGVIVVVVAAITNGVGFAYILPSSPPGVKKKAGPLSQTSPFLRS